MVYDCFCFFNELKLLELRLEELSPVVDFFVLVESTRTFTGNPKPLYFKENKRLFCQHAARIRHVIVDELPPNPQSAWDVESFQRNCILRGLGDAHSDDLIIISDVDEIPRRDVISSFTGEVAALELDHFYYRLNCKNLKAKWIGPALVRQRHLTSPEEARSHARHPRKNNIPVIPHAGWHFACMQNPAEIGLKLRSFSHQEFNTPEFTDEQAIAYKVRYGLDLVNRTNHFWCCVPLDSTFPSYVLQHRDKFKEFIADFEEFHLDRLSLLYEIQEKLRKASEQTSRSNKELVAVRAQLNTILHSRSWRATETLRRIARFARGRFSWLASRLTKREPGSH